MIRQKRKIRFVENQVAILNQNRPLDQPDGDRDDSSLWTEEDHANVAMMRRNILSPSFDVTELSLPPKYPKTDQQKAFLRTALQENFLFRDLSDDEANDLMDAMQSQIVSQNEVIVRQGDTGDYFYIVENGKVDFVLDEKGIIGHCGTMGYFGELALLYNCPRAVSCIAASPQVHLWKVDQKTFRSLIAHRSQHQHVTIKQLLRSISLFRDLNDDELNRFTNSLIRVQWNKGDRIVQKGDEGKVFYIVQKGKVKVHEIGLGQSHFEDQFLGPGDWFGERALLTGEVRAANVTALTNVTTLAMDRTTFESVLGSLRIMMEREMRKKVLRGIALFAKGCVSDEELSKIVDLMKEQGFRQGDKLVEAGKPYPMQLWIIRHGKLLVFSVKNEGTIYNFQSGDHFGDKSVRGDPGHISSHTAVCEEDLTAWVLTRQDIEAVLGDVERLGQAARLLDVIPIPHSDICLKNLTKRKVLGKGAFGKVWLVSHIATNEPFALKELSKVRILDLQQLKYLEREKNFLSLLEHPFILHLVACFQDLNKVYLVLPVIPGGELYNVVRHQRSESRGLSDGSAAFYAACIMEGLSHFHERKIAYRDLKLENVLIDEEGYCKIVDLGFAKVVETKTFTLVGTPEYLAPEIIMSKGYDKAVDYWAFGVLLFELAVGRSPFYLRGSSQIDLFKRIVLGHYSIPDFVHELQKDLIQKLLMRNPSKRLGNLKNGPMDILRHVWFEDSNISFPSIRRKEIRAPWVPKGKDDFDFFDDFQETENEKDTDRYLTNAEQDLFAGF